MQGYEVKPWLWVYSLCYLRLSPTTGLPCLCTFYLLSFMCFLHRLLHFTLFIQQYFSTVLPHPLLWLQFFFQYFYCGRACNVKLTIVTIFKPVSRSLEHHHSHSYTVQPSAHSVSRIHSSFQTDPLSPWNTDTPIPSQPPRDFTGVGSYGPCLLCLPDFTPQRLLEVPPHCRGCQNVLPLGSCAIPRHMCVRHTLLPVCPPGHTGVSPPVGWCGSCCLSIASQEPLGDPVSSPSDCRPRSGIVGPCGHFMWLFKFPFWGEPPYCFLLFSTVVAPVCVPVDWDRGFQFLPVLANTYLLGWFLFH